MSVPNATVIPIRAPSILSCGMDAASMKNKLKELLIKLRQENKLLTQSEFESLKETKWVYKNKDIGRILGRDYLEKTINELKLKHIKVPRKVAVVTDNKDTITLDATKDRGMRCKGTVNALKHYQ